MSEIENDGSKLMGFGKHKDLTYEETWIQQPGYCKWALEEENPSGRLEKFAEWLKVRKEHEEKEEKKQIIIVDDVDESLEDALRQINEYEDSVRRRSAFIDTLITGFRMTTGSGGNSRKRRSRDDDTSSSSSSSSSPPREKRQRRRKKITETILPDKGKVAAVSKGVALDPRFTCKICLSAPTDCVNLPCNHMVCCGSCALKFPDEIVNCAVCRTPLEEIRLLFVT